MTKGYRKTDISTLRSKIVGRYGRQKVNRGSHINFRILRKVFLFCVPLGIFFGIFYFVFLSHYFAIKNVNISGLKTVSENGVREEVGKVTSSRKWIVGKLSNYFLFPQDFAKTAIGRAFPKIGEIKIEKVYPEVLNISISEREAIGVWCKKFESGIMNYESGTECFYFDKEGVIFEPAPKSFGGLIMAVEDFRNVTGSYSVTLGLAVLTVEQIRSFEELRILIGKNFPFSAQIFRITQEGEFELFTSEGWRVLLDKKGGLEYELSNLKYLLDEQVKTRRGELDYVDLRLGNRLYYKYRGIDDALKDFEGSRDF